MEDIFGIIGEVGAPIAGSLVMGFFIFMVIKQILEGIVDQIKTLTMFCKSLENRARTMSNEMIKIDLSDEVIKEEKSIIEDLIIAAHNNAKIKLKSKTSEEISKASNDFGIPGFKWPL